MTTKTYRIKPLVWESVEPRRLKAYTTLQNYDIWADCGLYMCNIDDNDYIRLEQAKAAAQEHYETRLKQCLEEV